MTSEQVICMLVCMAYINLHQQCGDRYAVQIGRQIVWLRASMIKLLDIKPHNLTT